MSSELKRPVILICDDEEGIRESFKLILEDFYELKFAHNGLEGIEKSKALSPDLMFLDIKMPKLHGMETLRKIKKASPKLPVVIVTGYQSVEIAQEAIKNGASDYIPKPFESKHVLEVAARLTAKK